MSDYRAVFYREQQGELPESYHVDDGRIKSIDIRYDRRERQIVRVHRMDGAVVEIPWHNVVRLVASP